MSTKESALRSKLIRLAHAKPELRNKILPLVHKNASSYLEGADVAISMLAKQANLPVQIREAKGAKYPIPVPRGFESLFDKVFVEVVQMRSGSTSYVVRWRYDHANGGYNSYPIGQVGWDEKSERWFWRSDSGKSGFVSHGVGLDVRKPY